MSLAIQKDAQSLFLERWLVRQQGSGFQAFPIKPSVFGEETSNADSPAA